MWGLSRQVLDELLLQASAEAGVRVHQPARAESLLPGPPVTLAVRDLLTNAVEVTTPGLVIVADGKAALSPRPPPPTADFGVKTHFVHVDGPRDAIELFGTSGTYGGLAPIEQRRWNAAFSVPAPLLRQHAGNLEQLFERLVAANVTLRERMRHAERVSPWLASPLPRYAVTRDWPEGVLAVGNAAAALEPIGGEGMGLALRSAELVAEALAEADNDLTKLDRVGLMRRYNSLWRPAGPPAVPPRRWCRPAGWLEPRWNSSEPTSGRPGGDGVDGEGAVAHRQAFRPGPRWRPVPGPRRRPMGTEAARPVVRGEAGGRIGRPRTSEKALRPSRARHPSRPAEGGRGWSASPAGPTTGRRRNGRNSPRSHECVKVTGGKWH